MALWRIVKDDVATDFDTEAEMNTHITTNSLASGTYEIWYYMGTAFTSIHTDSDGWEQII